MTLAWERDSANERWLRYGLAVAAVGLTFVIKLPLDQAVGRGAPFQLFSLAIVLSAGFGGLGPGLLATALSTLIGSFFAVPVAPSADAGILRSAIFLLQGIGISLIGHFLERARRRAEEAYISLAADVAERERLDRELAEANRRAAQAFATSADEQRRAKEEAERQLAQIQDLARAAQEARTEAEEANRVKDQFLATLSHELRTPLNAILGWAQILRAGRLDPEAMARGLDVIERSSRAQAQLIGDLLDISRITSGKLRLEVRPVDPFEIVEAALSTVLPAAEAKGVSVERFLDPRVGPVSGDPDRLQQVVWNLLSNAVKFTPRGGRVEVHLTAADGHAEIRVRDTGQGIAPDLLPHVFELFRQDDGSSTRHQGGLGLGLSIVRELVELQGGTVHAESPGPGLGSTFTVVLPLAVSRMPEEPLPQPTTVAPVREEPCPPLAGLRLLAVDDEPDTLEVLAELLSLRGAEVATASSAAQALEILPEFEPDVLVSDISMPGRDGYDLIREVRTGRGPEDLPAVAVTAFAGPEDRKRALAAGFQVHMAKPVDPGELVNVIARLAAS